MPSAAVSCSQRERRYKPSFVAFGLTQPSFLQAFKRGSVTRLRRVISSSLAFPWRYTCSMMLWCHNFLIEKVCYNVLRPYECSCRRAARKQQQQWQQLLCLRRLLRHLLRRCRLQRSQRLALTATPTSTSTSASTATSMSAATSTATSASTALLRP